MKKFLGIFASTLALYGTYHYTQQQGGQETLVGKINGKLSVNQGSASYKIPIHVSPGIKQTQPKLSVQYRSRGGNGILGENWSLNGVSAVTRCAASYLVDGFTGSISYDSNDRFCLDGNRLILVAGTYGADGSEYRTEKESWRKITAHYDGSGNSCGGGPCSFSIQLKDGRVLSYGGANSSSFIALGSDFNNGPKKGAVRAWSINKTVDLYGNTINFYFTTAPIDSSGQPVISGQGTGGYYISRIDYTENTKASPASVVQRSVQFFYEKRTDVQTHYRGGAKKEIQARLTSIDTCLQAADISQDLCSDENLVFSYAFNYGESQVGESQISEITLCSPTNCFPATNLSWSTGPLSYNQGQNRGSFSKGDGSLIGDFNGDGLTDIFSYTGNKGVIYTYQGGGFSPRVASANLEKNYYVGDFNGDGLSDILSLTDSNTGFMNLSIGQNFNPVPINSAFQRGAYFETGDFNGNGLTDILSIVNAQACYLYEWGGNQFQQKNCEGDSLTLKSEKLAGDFNGDGFEDLYTFTKNQNGGSLYLSTAKGFKLIANTNVLLGDKYWASDFNGDGLSDIITENSSGPNVYFGTGTGFISNAIQISLKDKTWVGDFNGDGLSDIFTAQSGSSTIYFSTANVTSLFKAVANSISFSGDMWTGDFNGDGITDVFSSDGTSSGNITFATTSTSNGVPGLITSIIDGLGAQINLDWQPLTNSSIYSKILSSDPSLSLKGLNLFSKLSSTPMSPSFFSRYPVKTVQSSNYVLAQYEQVNSPSINSQSYSYRYSYLYERLLYNYLGRGNLGYGSVTKRNYQRGLKTTRYFRQDYPYNVKVATRNKCPDSLGSNSSPCKNDDPTLEAQSTYLYLCQNGQDGNACVVNNTTYDPGASKSVVVLLQSNAMANKSFGFQLNKEYLYDQYGNMTVEKNLGDTQEPHPVFICRNYYNDPVNWLYGFPLDKKRSTVLNCPTSQADWSNYKYNNSEDLFWSNWTYYAGTFGVENKIAWDNQNNIWVGKNYSYDGFGNVISHAKTYGNPYKKDPATEYVKVYDATFHSFPVKNVSPVPNPAQKGSASLISEHVYDARFGLKVATKGPNGQIAISCLDDFGRHASAQGPPPTNEVVKNYDVNCLNNKNYSSVDSDFKNAKMLTLSQTVWKDQGQGSSSSIVKVESYRPSWEVTSGQEWFSISTFLDGLGRHYKTSFIDSSSGKTVNQVNSYESRHLIYQKSLPFFVGDPVYYTTYFYDPLGRTTKKTKPFEDQDGTIHLTTTTWKFSTPNTILKTEADGDPSEYQAKTTFGYYKSKRKTTSLVVVGDNATTQYDYNADGKVINIIGPKTNANDPGVVNKTAYDSLGRRISFSETNAGSKNYFFNNLGSLVKISDSYGNVQTSTYDNIGRPLVKVSTNPTRKLEETDSFVYDLDATSSGEYLNLLGRLFSVTSTSTIPSVYKYSYDSYGKKMVENIYLNNTNYKFVSDHNPHGKITSISLPDSKKTTISYNYLPNNYLETISQNENGAAEDKILGFSDFNSKGRARTYTYGNKIIENIEYDVLSNIRSQKITGASEQYAHFSYNWDPLNHVSDVYDCNYIGNQNIPLCAGAKPTSQSNYSESFGYSNKRLIFAEGPYGKDTFSYDLSGNNITNNAINYSYNGNQLIKGSDGTAIQYDSLGRRVRKEVGGSQTTYLYGAKRRLTEVKSNGKTVEEYAYDYKERRIYKKEFDLANNITALTYYVGSNYLLTDFTNGTSQETVSVTNGLSHVSSITRLLSGKSTNSVEGYPLPNTTSYFHSNQNGSNRLTTDQDGKLSSRVTYHPYGKIFDISPADSNFFRPKFGQKEWDIKSGLYFFNSRYYDPETMQFISADSDLGAKPFEQDAYNRYAYGLNSPATYMDPSGHSSIGKWLLQAFTTVVTTVATIAASVLTDGIAAPELVAADVAIDSAVDVASDVAVDALTDVVTDSAEDTASGVTEEAANSAEDGTGMERERELEQCENASFPADVKVQTLEGSKNIQDIKVGDLVWGYNIETRKKDLFPVTKLVSRKVRSLIKIFFKGESVLTTKKHPFWVQGGSWKSAETLRPLDKIRTMAGKLKEVLKVERKKLKKQVYNFVVASAHSYFILNSGFLVHNPMCYINLSTKAVQEETVGDADKVRARLGFSSYNEMWDYGKTISTAADSKYATDSASGISGLAASKGYGDAASDAAADYFSNAEREEFFHLPSGNRYVDVYNKDMGLAIEMKVGRMSKSSFILKEAVKDSELGAPKVDDVGWVFVPSPVTGKTGATGPLLDELMTRDFNVIIFHK